MVGDHWDEVPLETWQKLAGYAVLPQPLDGRLGGMLDHGQPLTARSMASLLRELRSDFGADSAFYQDVTRRVRRGELFTVERLLNGESPGTIDTHHYTDRTSDSDRDHDLRIYESLFNAKWNSIRRRCPLTKDLPAAVARMVRDDDGIDYRAILAHKFRAAYDLEPGDPRAASNGLVCARAPRDLAHIDAKTKLLARLAMNDYQLANRPTYASGKKKRFHGGRLATVPHEFVMIWADRQRGIKKQGHELDDLMRELEHRTSTDGERPLRPFCHTGATPFAHEAANRGHEHPELAADDPCWTDAMLRQLMDMAVEPDGPGSLEEELWDASTLDRHMAQCETPRELRKPLQEFRSMMAVVRAKFSTIAQRASQARELYARFVSAHDVTTLPAKSPPRAKPGPTSPARQRLVAHRVLVKISLAARSHAFDQDKWLTGNALEQRMTKLDEPVRKILRRLASDVHESASLLDYWGDRLQEEKERTGRLPEIRAIRRADEPQTFTDAISDLHKDALARVEKYYNKLTRSK